MTEHALSDPVAMEVFANRLLSITEVVGMVDDTVALQELYRHESQGGQVDSWHSLGVPPQTPKLAAWKAGNAARGMADGGGWPL